VIAIGGSSSTAAPDVRRKVVDLLAVLGADDMSGRGSGISSDGHSVLTKKYTDLKRGVAMTYLEDDAHNSGSGLLVDGLLRLGLGGQCLVTKAVVEVEAAEAQCIYIS